MLLGFRRDFKPTLISGCQLWLRADLGITLVGSKVSVWADQSGNGRNVVQGTDANRPTYVASDAGYRGQPTLDHSAANTVMMQTSATALVAQPQSIVVVGHPASGSSATRRLCSISSTLYGQATLNRYSATQGTTIISSTSDTWTTKHVAIGIINGASSKILRDSTSTTVATGTCSGTPTTSVMVVGGAGGSTGWTGTIAEFIVYNSDISSHALFPGLVAYLKSRYAIT